MPILPPATDSEPLQSDEPDKVIDRRSLVAGLTGAVASGPVWAGVAQSNNGSFFPNKVEPPSSPSGELHRAIQKAAGSGRYVPGIGASYWAHPQDGLYLPPGIYDAGDIIITGNTSPFPALSIWAIPGSVVIRIPDGDYLFQTGERLNWLFVFGVTFVGGKGVLQHLFSGSNVNGRFVFERCVFDNYTECAIGNNAQDQPYLEVRGCTFMAAEKSSAIGISWGGYSDGSIIEGNAFLRNRYHVKVGPNPSGSIHVLRNDFLRWDKTTPLGAAIWLVPEITPGRFGSNSGWGTIISGNKFGSENMQPDDVRILVAREGPGNTRQTRAPSARFDPGGAEGAFLSGVTIENSRISCPGDVRSPFMRSWISEVRNFSYINNRHDGGRHSYLCEFMGPRKIDYANANWTVRLENADSVLGSSPFLQSISNAAIGPQLDLSATQAIAEETILPGTGGDDTSFQLLASADRPEAFKTFGDGVSLTPVADHAGYNRAVEIALVGQGGGVADALHSTKVGHQAWLAVDLKRASTRSAEAVEVRIFNYAAGIIARKLRFVLPAEWRRVRIPFTLPAATDPQAWQYVIVPIDPTRKQTFQVARLYVYHGREPRADGHVSTLGDGKWDGAHLVLGTTHLWEEGGALYMKATGTPAHATDGTRLG